MDANAVVPLPAEQSTTLLLVRHGQTRSNVTGYYMGMSQEDLDNVGYAQVRSLSKRLANLPISLVYTSPLQRARTTASVIAEPHDLEPKALDDLLENNLGDWQGLHADEVKEKWPELWRQSRIDPSSVTMPGGESFAQVNVRAVRAFESIISANPGKLAVAVTHEIIVKLIVAHVLGVSNSIYRRFEIKNASLSIIRLVGDKTRLVTLNDTSHLEVL